MEGAFICKDGTLVESALLHNALREELLPLAYTDDVGAPIVAQIDTVFP